VADSCPTADAAATSIGNRIDSAAGIEAAIEAGKGIEEIDGIVVILGEKIGLWGDLEVVSLKDRNHPL
jgi:ApbE superfamily uncharacterized protein (UPF0280 family)